MIKREIFSRLKKDLNRKEIMALIGSRQVGKTTLMKELYSTLNTDSSVFLNFEDLDLRKLFETNIKLFIDLYVKNKKYLFIDEFQYIKDGGQKLKYLYDEFEIKIIISGSSGPELAIQSLQYLVGRVRIYEIFPISFEEFIEYKNSSFVNIFNEIQNQNSFDLIQNLFEEYLIYGGYPKVVIEDSRDEKELILKDIVNTYFLKEIKDILEYKNIFEFENLLQRFALQDGGILNKNSFSQDLEINKNKVNEMINVLDKTYIISLVRPFLKNKIKEIIKSPKSYIQDLGLKNSLIKNFNNLNLKQDKGTIYENFIYNSLRKKFDKINYWNFKNEYEIDFIYEKNDIIYAFEIKSKLKSNKLTKSMQKFIDDNSPKYLYVFNENIDFKLKYKNTTVLFTNYINVINILNNIK